MYQSICMFKNWGVYIVKLPPRKITSPLPATFCWFLLSIPGGSQLGRMRWADVCWAAIIKDSLKKRSWRGRLNPVSHLPSPTSFINDGTKNGTFLSRMTTPQLIYTFKKVLLKYILQNKTHIEKDAQSKFHYYKNF